MHDKKIAILRYARTGAARCSAMAVRAIRARAPVASTRPPAEQKIHAGKKEPKMLYSGAWEQPTDTSGATRDKPARGPSEVVRRRLRSVDSVFITGHLNLTFRLSHSVRDGIYWTKVSVNTLVLGDPEPVQPLRVRRPPTIWFDRYVRPIDSAPHFCLNRCWMRKNYFPVRFTRTKRHGNEPE